VRLLLTIGAYLTSLAVTLVTAYFAVMILAGPHGGLLPNAFEKPVLVLGWLCVLLFPAWIATLAWRRLGGTRLPRSE
jgi:hypothetical protein